MHPQAAGKEILLLSRLASLTFGLLSGVFCIVLLQIGININWLFFVIGYVAGRCSAPSSVPWHCPLACLSITTFHRVAGRAEALSLTSQRWKDRWVKQLSLGCTLLTCRLLVASVFPPISFLLTWNKVGKVRQHASE